MKKTLALNLKQKKNQDIILKQSSVFLNFYDKKLKKNSSKEISRQRANAKMTSLSGHGKKYLKEAKRTEAFKTVYEFDKNFN